MPDLDEVNEQWKWEQRQIYQEDKMRILRNERKKKKKVRKKKMSQYYHIENYDSADGPRFRIKSCNGKILAHSEAYSSRSARNRTANNLASYCKISVEYCKK